MNVQLISPAALVAGWARLLRDPPPSAGHDLEHLCLNAAVLELVLPVHGVRSAREFPIEPTPAHSDSVRPAGCA
jgi:hypothetical protein